MTEAANVRKEDGKTVRVKITKVENDDEGK